MMPAPAITPSLDEALRAMGNRVPPGLGVVDQFLERLDDVRECPAMVLDQAQAAALEGAYLAGFRCADESGHVLVVSLPALLAYLGHGAPSSRLSWRARLDQLRVRLARRPQSVGYALGQAALVFDNDELDQWKARALAAEKKIRDEQFARLFAVPYGEKQHAG